MKVIAHRGANKEAFENSFAAFEAAIAGGAERIELDVHMAADGSLPVVHDDNLSHATGLNARIKKLNRSDLTNLKLKNGGVFLFKPQENFCRGATAYCSSQSRVFNI